MQIIFDTNTIISLVTLFGIIIIKFNDLKHAEKDLKEIKVTQKEHGEKLNNLDKNYAVLKTKTEALEKKIKN